MPLVHPRDRQINRSSTTYANVVAYWVRARIATSTNELLWTNGRDLTARLPSGESVVLASWEQVPATGSWQIRVHDHASRWVVDEATARAIRALAAELAWVRGEAEAGRFVNGRRMHELMYADRVRANSSVSGRRPSRPRSGRTPMRTRGAPAPRFTNVRPELEPAERARVYAASLAALAPEPDEIDVADAACDRAG